MPPRRRWRGWSRGCGRCGRRSCGPGAGASPAEFGAHSLRIGGATALFKAGASQIDIMTMGRWSSDCYRLYVRACFGHAVEWSRKAGSTSVDDVAEEYKEVDCY